MRGASTIRRIGGFVAVAAALAGAAATPATAAVAPACTARLAAADAGTTASCSFDNQYDYATISIVTEDSVLVTVSCRSPWGTTTTTSRPVNTTTAWAQPTRGYCTLTLTAERSGTTALGSSTPTIGPICDTCLRD